VSRGIDGPILIPEKSYNVNFLIGAEFSNLIVFEEAFIHTSILQSVAVSSVTLIEMPEIFELVVNGVGRARTNAMSLATKVEPSNCATTVYVYVPAVVAVIDGERFNFTYPGSVGVADPLPPMRDGVTAPAGIDFKKV
jgi:hypothetical protein